MRKTTFGALAFATLLAATTLPSQAEVIRVDMLPSAAFSGRTPPTGFTGVEPDAAAADPIFGSDGSNTWNFLSIAPSGTITTNPSFSNLVDSTGATTSVGISFSGNLTSANDEPYSGNISNDVENNYFLICGNDCDGVSTSVTYTISGLPVDTQVALYLYSPNFSHSDSGDTVDQPNRGYQLTANAATINVPSGTGPSPYAHNALAFVTTTFSGDISGTWSVPNGNEGNWSGFQIGYSVVPLPAALPLFGTGLGLMGVLGWRRRRKAAAAVGAA